MKLIVKILAIFSVSLILFGIIGVGYHRLPVIGECYLSKTSPVIQVRIVKVGKYGVLSEMINSDHKQYIIKASFRTLRDDFERIDCTEDFK